MVHLPEELVEQFERENVLLFVGEGINSGILASSSDLASELASLCNYPPKETQTLSRVAGYFELIQHNRSGLIRLVRDRLDTTQLLPSRTHQLIAQLRPRVVVNTCYDRLLERAFREAAIPCASIVSNADVPFIGNKVLLVWLWGVLDQPDTVVITENDRRRFLDDRASLADILRGELARRSWLFVGFVAEDEWFRNFCARVNQQLDRHRQRAYFVGVELSSYLRVWWEDQNAEIIEAEIQPFLEALITRLKEVSRERIARPIEIASAPLPNSPYKFLDYYESKDSAIFFGRQQETQRLSALIHAHRLVLFYGASGVGKTSLLQAGVVAQLEHAGSPYLVMSVRILEEPSLIIRRILKRLLPKASLPENDSLAHLLAVAAEILARPLIIILDQFEEFFIRLGSQARASFIAELGELYDARDIPIKVVLSLREDWLASVSEIERRIPEIFRIKLRLLPLTIEQALLAITAPIEPFGIAYAPDLLHHLLNDLQAGTSDVMPPQLQLACDTLYRALDPGEHQITLEHYKRLGGVRGILQRYLANELARLPTNERALARGVLEELLTSQGTKAAKTVAELALGLAVDSTLLMPVLDKLARSRLLRIVDLEDAGTTYELAHEYLIQEISVSKEVRQRKQIEELLSQEIIHWQTFKTLLGADKLAKIDEMRSVLRLSDAALELLLRSALTMRWATSSYWLEQIQDPARRLRIIRELLTTPDIAVRSWAIYIVASWKAPEIGELLVGMALNDPADEVWRQAAESLVEWGGSAWATKAISSREESPPERRSEVLASIRNAGGALAGLPPKTSLDVIRTLSRRRVRQAQTILVARTLSGALGGAIGGAIFLTPLGYASWSPTSASSPINAMGEFLMAGLVLGATQASIAALCITLADIVVKRPTVGFRFIGGLVGGWLAGICFAILAVLTDIVPRATTLGISFLGWSVTSMLAVGGAALIIPAPGKLRPLGLQVGAAAITAAVVYLAARVLITMIVVANSSQNLSPLHLIVGALGYALLEGMTIGGMALALGIADRSQLRHIRAQEVV